MALIAAEGAPPAPPDTLRWRWLPRGPSALGWAAAVAALICTAPALAVLAYGLGAPLPADAASKRLAVESVLGLTLLLFSGGGAALVLGVGAAWLTTLCAFPGRALFAWTLALPLATPAYILAYAYGGLTGPTGPFPLAVPGAAKAAAVYALAFYPYVYLAARAAFATQSVCALEAARSLGARPGAAFLRVALPMARGGIVAGLALALMEIAADYGAAAYFGVRTLTTGVFHAWFARGEPQLALFLASLLVLGAVVLLVLERADRGGRAAHGLSTRWRPLPRYRLGPFAATFTIAALTLLLVFAALLPLAWLARLALLAGPPTADLGRALWHSLALAGGGAALALLAALALAGAQRARLRGAGLAAAAASAGYAAPGAALALGALAVFALLREQGFIGGLTGGVAIAGLLWIYLARFAAAGIQPIAAGLERASPAIVGAARTLGAPGLRRFLRVETPIAGPSVAAAALILFVEVLRELPATLILRPFDFDTLAVLAHAYASDDRLAQAATPALLVVAAGLLPIALLTRATLTTRAGA